jgi:hypothetical protein
MKLELNLLSQHQNCTLEIETNNKYINNMGFEFKSDQEPKQMVDTKTTLSVNEPTIVEENLVQEIFAEGEEERLAIQFLEENALYSKFLLWCGIQEQLKSLKDSLVTTIN